MHRFQLHNNDIRDAALPVLSAGQIGLLSGWGVFSTLRVYDGVMFQWTRHWQRMKRDAERMHVPFPDDSGRLESALYKLIDANRAFNSTLRVVVVRNRGGLWEGPGITRDYDVIAFTANVVSWPDKVKLGVAPHARLAASEFAGTKYLSWAENLTRYERAHQDGFDEVILLNERSEVAECTSANVFIVEGSQVWTPPLSAGGLSGITRNVLLEDIRVPDISIGEKMLDLKALSDASEVFITSTTRELLPVAAIEGLHIRGGNSVCAKLRQAFSEFAVSYTAARRKPVYN